MTISQLKKSILRFIRPKAPSVFDILDPEGLKLLTRLRVHLSHLKEHKYRHNFADTFNPIGNCGLLEIESTAHYLLRCTFFSDHRKILLESMSSLRGDMSNLSDTKFLHGNRRLSAEINQAILKATICFLKSTGRFHVPLIA